MPLFYWMAPGHGEIGLAGYALYLALLVAVSLMILRWIERPCRFGLMRRLGPLVRSRTEARASDGRR